MYLGVFRPAKYVSQDSFGGKRHAQEIVRPDFLFEKIRHVYFVGEPRSLGIYRPSLIDGNLLGYDLLCAACPYTPHTRSSLLKEGGKVENQRQRMSIKIKLNGENPVRLLDFQNVVTLYMHLSGL